MPEAINGASQVNGMNEQLKGSYAISRQGAASAYQPASATAPATEAAGVGRQSSIDAPAFSAELSAVPDRNGDPQEQVQSIRQKLYQGVELSTEEMDFIEEHDEDLYNKAQEAEDVRRELRSSLEKAGNGGEAQAIAQQAAKAVAQGMSSAGAITTAQETSAANRRSAGGNDDAVEQTAATGSMSAANPAPETQTASNQAAAAEGSVNGTAQQGSAQEIIAMNAAQGQASANVSPNAGMAESQSGGPVLNVTAPQQASPNAIDHESGVLSANNAARNAVAANSTGSSSLSQLDAASSVTNPTIVNQSTVSGTTGSAPTAGSAAVTNVAAAAGAAAAQPTLGENNVAEVSAVPTIAERLSTGEIGTGAQQADAAATPAQQEEVERRAAAVRPIAGTGKTVQKQDNKAAQAQQAMREQREAAAQQKAAKAEAQKRSEARIERFMKQQESQQNAEPSRAVVNSRAVRRTWEQYTNNQQAAAKGDAAGAVTAANNTAYAKIRSYNKMNDTN